MNINPVIVIPVHKIIPTKKEIISLKQCQKILGHRNILILAPNGLDLSDYKNILPDAIEFLVNPKWMASIEAYNRMMISPFIFNALKEYTHVLIHEPDAIVLRDDLDYWCNQDYDYIGAPWFQGLNNALPDASFRGVGNFGFSLLRISKVLIIVASKKRWYPYRNVFQEIFSGLKGDFKRLSNGIIGMGNGGKLKGAGKLYLKHCDIFWCELVPEFEKDFKIASADTAIFFSWEVLPQRCLQLTNGKLPFGIHAWARYDFDFLKPHLESAGVDFSSLYKNNPIL
jgi:hypothetical protein